MGTTSAPRFVLRDLPFSARLVLTIFLFSVGLGYVSALVQLHFKHAGKGEFLPTAKDAERIFHGDVPKTKIEKLIDADKSLPFARNGQMRQAFAGKPAAVWERAIAGRAKKRNISEEEAKQILEKERETERLAMLAWIRSGASEKEYDKDNFPLPKDLENQPLVKDFKEDDGKSIKIKSLIEDRCQTCHTGADPKVPPLTSYAELSKFLVVKDTRMDADSLAQTTHVHLLGFAMLYGLTGFILAFSSYPAFIRCVLCPWPLFFQVIDIGCWWLAREAKPYGPMFASVIPLTGAAVAVGLVAHIMLSVFNMYDAKGKFVLVLLLAGAGAGGVLYVGPIVLGEIKREKDEAADALKPKAEDDKKKDDDPGMEKDKDPKEKDPKENDKEPKEKDPKEKDPEPDDKVVTIERLITADPTLKMTKKGQMRSAFFKDSDDWLEAIETLMNEKKISEAEAKKLLEPQREGERLALLKWVQAGGPKKAYDDDAFTLPADWNKEQKITEKYVRDGGKAVKITSIIKDRCIVCHGPDGAQDDVPFDKYELLKKHILDPGAKPKPEMGEPAASTAGSSRIESRRIEPARAPRIAAADTADPLARAAHRTVLLHRGDEVFAAAWLEPAQRRQNRPQNALVAAHAADQEKLQDEASRPQYFADHDRSPS